MNKDLFDRLKKIKNRYEKDGFIILGYFGSYARDQQTDNSDLDLLYEMTDSFYKKYPGWDVYPVIDSIAADCEMELGLTVDLANKNALNEIGRKYIMSEVVYVR